MASGFVGVRTLPSIYGKQKTSALSSSKLLTTFTDIGPNLARNISTTSELESICGMFASKKAPAYDSFPMHVIKYSFHLISAPLADIINLSLLKGIFPNKLKIAKIIPIFEAEDPCFLETTDLFLCCLISPNFLKKSYTVA